MAATRCLVGVLLIALVASGQELGVGDIKEPLSMGTMQQMPPFMAKLMKSNFSCEFCEEFFDLLLNITTNNQTLAGIQTLLYSLCEWVPYQLYPECIGFVKSVPGLIDFLANVYLDGTYNCYPLCGPGGDDRIPDVMNIMKLVKSMPKKPSGY